MRLLFTLLIVLTGNLALAQESVDPETVLTTPTPDLGLESINHRKSLSEALYVPAAGRSQFSVRPQLEYSKAEARGNLSGRQVSSDANHLRYWLSYHKTFANSDLALKLKSFVGEGTETLSSNGSKSDYKYSGLGDMSATLTKLVSKDRMNIYFGGEVSLSPGPHSFAYVDRPGNYYSGGHSVMPFTAFEAAHSYGSVGGSFGYRVFGTRRAEGRRASEETTGGNTIELKGFSEFQVGKNLAGALLSLDMIGSKAIGNSNRQEFEDEKRQLAKGKLYGKVLVSDDVSITPAVEYAQVVTKTINSFSYSQNDTTTVSVGLDVIF